MTTLNTTMPTVADAIEHTLEWLDRQGCREKTDERRGTLRSRYRVSAKIMVDAPRGKTEQFEVTTRNLSRTGLSFIHRQLIYPRQIVQIQLPLPDRSVRSLEARVIRVRPAGTGFYEIGVEFTDIQVTVA